VRARCAQRLVIRCTQEDVARVSERLAAVLAPWRPGACPITIEYSGNTASGALNLGAEWTVRVSRELLEQLETLVGGDAVQVVYGAPGVSAGTSSADGR
jgi:hypothetical protein